MLFGCCIKNVEDVARVRDAGYDYFEFSAAALAAMSAAEFEALVQASEAARLPCLGLNSFSSGTPALIGHAFSLEELGDYLLALCRRAGRLGVKTLGIGAPKARILPEDYPRAVANTQMREFLVLASLIAEHQGIRLVLEALHDRSCNYLNTVEEALIYLKAARLDDVGLVLDFYHMEVMGEGLDRIALAAPRLLHTHISTCGPALERSFPLMDELEKYRAILTALREAGYDGTLSVEPNAYEPEKAPETLRMLRLAAAG
ncbi:MAG: sugar phosphate isomerase/epimerase [Oscillospiraceae bacterium]|nr:sugar phosphate isomerase/epimerase [Oscillospiraceae bacterium]